MSTCVDAFKNLNIVNQQNLTQIGPCCLSPTQTVQFVDFHQDAYLNQVREAWQNGQFPTACEACQKQEINGQRSRRQGSNQWYQDHGLDNQQVELVRLDYWTGDQCNLACVICGPDWSSTWKQELNLPRQEQKVIINQAWQDLDLSQLKFVHFNGGEPLLSKEHVKFLQAIPNPAQTHLNYNTNGTVIPSTELIKIWQKFALVQLDFSIDDIEQRFEYQRYPAKWSELLKNLEWFRLHAPHNCMFSVNTAVGVLNYQTLSDLQHWLKQNFHTNRFGDLIEHRQQPVYGLLGLENWLEKRKEIFNFLETCDQRRGISWKRVFPNLVDLLSTDK